MSCEAGCPILYVLLRLTLPTYHNIISRYEHEGEPPEWKERGTGDIRIMVKEEDNTARILMRREKTMKVCANHFIKPWMDMKPNVGSKKAWVWKTRADYADEEPKQEVRKGRLDWLLF